MFKVLLYTRPFYLDQLYNPHADNLGMFEFYREVIPSHWTVYQSAENDPVSKIHGLAAFSCLYVSHCTHWRVHRTPAFHRIPVLAAGRYAAGYTTNDEPMWARIVRSNVFKIIRVRLCRQWLARVSVEICRAQWCDYVVADIITAQLEAWFAAVPHEEVQWSEYDDGLRIYRVKQW